jgi:RimJ/RimL family protein N-acetyltransferase
LEKELQIRPVNDSDAEFLYQLMNCPSLLERLNEVPTTRQDWTDAISEWLKDEDEEDYIVLAGDTPMGWLGVNGLRGGNGIAYLKMAAFLPEYQGRGYGTCSIRVVLDNLKRKGIEQVFLYTDSDNAPAQACYRKCGFKVVESLTETLSNGKDVDRVKMVSCLK